jgi:hypothetical protein
VKRSAIIQRAISSLIFRLRKLHLGVMASLSEWLTVRRSPRLLKAYEVISQGGGHGASHQPFKGYDLQRILDRQQPRYIVELGSGTTTAVFSDYVRRTQAKLVTFEHDAQWAQITQLGLAAAGFGDNSPVRIVGTYEGDLKRGSGYVEPIPNEADFIYVDGPPTLVQDGCKQPNLDVVKLFDRGARPRCIVVDGRTETVDLILQHPSAASYNVEFEFIYAFRHGMWAKCLKFKRHTVMVTKS